MSKDAVEENVMEELNLDKKITIKNIAGWGVSFSRKTEIGDVDIAPGGSARLSRNEIITQVQGGNTLLSGIDGLGSHATIYIDDAPTRVELGFDSEDGKVKQEVFTDEKVKEVFSLKTQKAFEKRFVEAFCTRAEKYAVINAIKRLGLNDYNRIRFAEKYTGYSM